MAEDGISDFGTAKRKAARNLGVGEGEALPTNDEVEVELRAWQSLYQEDEQRERIQSLRAAALEVMEVLAEFHPYLTGGALNGTAGRYSPVNIELFADSSKDVEIALLSQGISYETMHNSRQDADTRLQLDWDDVPVEITIFPIGAEHRQSRSAASGKTRPRASASMVEALLRTDLE